MQTIDIIIIVLLALSAINGYSKGLVSELASLGALILGVYAAFYFSDVTADFLVTMFEFQSKYLNIIAFVLTLVLVMAVIVSLGKVVEKLVDVLFLGFFNRIAGALFGVLKGILILSLLIMLLNYIGVADSLISKEKQQNSRFFEDVESFAPYLFQRFEIDETLQDLNEKHAPSTQKV